MALISLQQMFLLFLKLEVCIQVCQFNQERKYVKILEQKTKISSELCVECLEKRNVVGIVLLREVGGGGGSNFDEDKVQRNLSGMYSTVFYLISWRCL